MGKAAIPHPSTKEAEPEVARFNWLSQAIIIFFALLYVGLDRLSGKPRLADVDDALRAIQLEQLWKTGNWYDLTLPMIRMPEAYVSPWSRLVDLPYILISKFLTYFSMDREAALHWSFLIWPPIMLTALCVLIFDIIRRLDLLGRGVKVYVTLAVILFMIPMIGEFTPGRIDHHNMQILLLALMLAGVMRFNIAGGIVCGLGASMAASIGLECLPIIATIYGALLAAWLFSMPGSRRMLCPALLSMAIAMPLLALVLTGPAGLSSVRCDAPTAPYIYIVSVSSLIVGIIVAFANVVTAPWRKALLVGAPVALVCIGFAFLFPTCLSGPYAIIDPVSRHFWFDRIEQERSALILFQRGAIPQITLFTILAVALLMALPSVIERLRRGRVQEFVLYVGALATLLLTMRYVRYVNYATALVPLLLPLVIAWIIGALEGRAHRKTVVGLWAAFAAPVGVAALLFVLVPRDMRQIDTIDIMDNDDCQRDDLKRLDTLAPGLIIAPSGLSMTIAKKDPAGLSVAGIPFHRASPGLRRTYLAFTSPDPQVRREALAPFDYVAVCRVNIQLDARQAPLYAALASGGIWPGLVPVASDASAPLQLFRINHDQLQ